MKSGSIGTDYGVKLQNAEAQFFSLRHAVAYQLLSDALSLLSFFYGVACVADMTAPPNIIGMENV